MLWSLFDFFTISFNDGTTIKPCYLLSRSGRMGSSNIRDILTCFSPSLDFFAVSSGDGRIKIWDTRNGQLQTEFSDIFLSDNTNNYAMLERGHLSVDYTCMNWLSSERKKKRKLGTTLVLGTGSGDVLALDVSAGQLKWKVSDCHPGGVSAISYSSQVSCIYTSGADGMVCEIDPNSGNLLRKFKASVKAISSMSVSPDGKIVATASAQMKIFNCSDHKKVQKFSGHPGTVRCMILTEGGNYILSSAVSERYVAIWRIDGSKKQSASCVLAMEHPAVYLASRCVDDGDANDMGFYVLAISETGICYFWYGKDIDELCISKPTKISLSLDDDYLKNHKNTLPAIFAAKIQSIVKRSSAHVFFAHGLPIKPYFEKIIVQHGKDLKLNFSEEGILLPLSQSSKSRKRLDVCSGATVLDRANAEDALLPIPKVFEFHDKLKRDQILNVGSDYQTELMDSKVVMEKTEANTATCCMEDRLRSLGILSCQDDVKKKSMLSSTIFKGIDLEATMPQRKMRTAILSMTPCDAYKLLTILLSVWQSRSCSRKYVLPWICSILVNQRHQILSEDHENAALNLLYRISKHKASTAQSLMQLSGRLQLLTTQIDKAAQLKTETFPQDSDMIESEDEVVDEVIFREEDETQSSSDAVDD
ncbi:hypothetical protein Nepgr_030386 [Nepenthes gracilis]|uniref:Small-subunit processome Utp12 domain-containing protein n=1 Tax=Nepenthes gracilis TaxID=150966 RepID=A0AAD3Y453_NEPGR|nr:hypothetical protein Nepgr_030386 [Nepenthes gracilis]